MRAKTAISSARKSQSTTANMLIYLIDTNVLSEMRKGSRAAESVREWFSRLKPEQIRISVITMGELRRGIVMAERRDHEKAAHLSKWYQRLETDFKDNIVSLTLEVMHRWASLPINRPMPRMDSLLAATALTHNFTLATRNVSDFTGCGANV